MHCLSYEIKAIIEIDETVPSIFPPHLKLTLNKKKGLPPSSTFRKCPDDKLTIYFAWPNLKSGQKTKWPNIVDRSVYIE